MADNDPKKASEDLSTVTRKTPRFAPGFYFLGQAQVRQNEVTEARKMLTKATELAPNWIEPKITLAQLHLAAGDHELASDEVDKILKVQPNNETVLLIKGVVFLRTREIDQALAIFQQARKINPKSVAAHINMAAVYAVKKNYPEDLKQYEQALTFDPNRVVRLVPSLKCICCTAILRPLFIVSNSS